MNVEQLPQNNAGRGHQAPRKAAHSLQKEIGQNIKEKKERETKVRDGDQSWGGSCEGEVSTIGNHLTGGCGGCFGISEGNITRREKKKKKSPQKTCLIANASREVVQRLMSPTSEQGLGREAGVASSVLRVRPGPDFPEDNPRELT